MGHKTRGNKKATHILLTKETFDALKAIHGQMQMESGGPSWNRFIEAVLAGAVSGNEVLKGYYSRYVERIKSGK